MLKKENNHIDFLTEIRNIIKYHGHIHDLVLLHYRPSALTKICHVPKFYFYNSFAKFINHIFLNINKYLNYIDLLLIWVVILYFLILF